MSIHATHSLSKLPSHFLGSTSHSASFDSFLSALDVSTAQPIPFAAPLTYLPLLQQLGHIQPAILGDATEGSRLFIRACYPSMWKLIEEQRNLYITKSTRSGGTLVTGNAGVGKSIFLAYVIKQLRSLTAPPTIIYHDISAEQCFVMTPGVAKAVQYEHCTASMVSNSSAVYLVDIGGTAIAGPLKCDAFTIVVASPHAKSKDIVQHWWSHAKFPPVFYMPCWSGTECSHVLE